MVENQRASVWFINGNDLKHCNKIISKVNYKGFEIAVMKQDLDQEFQQFIFKDKNGEYWELGNAPIQFKEFIHASEYEYSIYEDSCDSTVKFLHEDKLKGYFEKRIKEGKYFNKCELEYIYRYLPDIYDGAKTSRENIIEKNRQRNEQEKQKDKEWKQERIDKTNTEFKEKLKEIKYKIFTGETVNIEDLEYYKNDDYYDGRVVQNNILYLAKQYNIKIPLATQGFINNRLVRYNFKTGQFAYNIEKNRRPSEKMHEYLEQIYEKVKEEYQQEHEIKKKKSIGAR